MSPSEIHLENPLICPTKNIPSLLIFCSFFLFMTFFPHLSSDGFLLAGGGEEYGRQQSMELQQKEEINRQGIGTLEMKRPDGGKDRIYYSITTEEEENERRKEESKKLDKSMEMLDNMIIFEKGGIKR